jgi:ABC-type spermidine/putrescine transport system permease subunit II
MKRFTPTNIVGSLVLVLLYLPISVAVAGAFNADETLSRWGGFTMRWFTEVSANERALRDFRLSMAIAVVATGIALLIAVATGVATRHMSTRTKAWIEMSTLVRIILPEVVIAVGLFLLMRLLHLSLGFTAIVVGHVVFLSAYATVIIQARFAALTDVLEEAAADLGASPWRTFWRVTMPGLVPAVVVAALLSFTFSFDDVVTSMFLGGANAETLPVLIMGLVRIRVSPFVNAIAVAVMAINLVALAIVAFSSSVRSVAGMADSATHTASADKD